VGFNKSDQILKPWNFQKISGKWNIPRKLWNILHFKHLIMCREVSTKHFERVWNKSDHILKRWIFWKMKLIIHYLRFYLPLKNISLIWRRHHCRWRATKFRPMLGTLGLWAGRDLYRATPAVTWGLGLCGLIRRTAKFSRLLRHAWGCGGPILTRILTVTGKWKVNER
jgi:hypothetical protein